MLNMRSAISMANTMCTIRNAGGSVEFGIFTLMEHLPDMDHHSIIALARLVGSERLLESNITVSVTNGPTYAARVMSVREFRDSPQTVLAAFFQAKDFITAHK